MGPEDTKRQKKIPDLNISEWAQTSRRHRADLHVREKKEVLLLRDWKAKASREKKRTSMRAFRERKKKGGNIETRRWGMGYY